MPIESSGLFSRWAHLYDAIYARKGKDYHAECLRLLEAVESGPPTSSDATSHVAPHVSRQWLDLACGTGEHLAHLSRLRPLDRYTGLDRNGEMLGVARAKSARATWIRADLRRLPFDGRPEACFDVILCLFAAIGYLADEREVRQVIFDAARCLRPGGVLIIEPPVTRERMQPPARSTLTMDFEGHSVRRDTSATLADDALYVRFDLEIGQHIWSETHRILVLSEAAFGNALGDAGLRVTHDPFGLCGSGLYLASRRKIPGTPEPRAGCRLAQ